MQETLLERYARWKSKRMALDKFPHDVLACIAEYLDLSDLESMLSALLKEQVVFSLQRSHTHVPVQLRTIWSSRRSIHNWCVHLHSMAEKMLYHCDRETTSVLALVDWTWCTRKPPLPVAEYGWCVNGTAHIHVDRLRLTGHLLSLFDRKLSGCRITFHRHANFPGFSYVDPTPFDAMLYTPYPHFIM